MPPAIRVENLSKSYRIGQASQRAPYRTLRESLTEAARSAWRRRPGDDGATEEFWALKGVDFEVEPGEVVGIIGRNGAGKSTLLKILSRITEPTDGRVELYGRIGSLLEVGTGFHPELTGRENIYLNGSILGMSRREIERKFDEIVEFAEIETFLDTPVKRYSSGMYIRLAFAIASNLNPEIMIVDEVLAVGDVAFQKKCLGKMGEVSRSGRTVLFVSHNNAAIEALCDRCVLLSRGSVVSDGPTGDVLAEYVSSGSDRSSGRRDLTDHDGRDGGSIPIMTEVVLGDGVDEPVSQIRMGSRLSVRVSYDLGERVVSPVLGVALKTATGSALFGVNNRFIPGFAYQKHRSHAAISCHFDRVPLMPGRYVIDLYFGDERKDLDVVHDAISFDVTESDVYGSGRIPPGMAGPFFLPASWDHRPSQFA
jgi:lipopolysaccharide transport system ATP-binding protein